jgi:hypothetical protein
MLSNPTPYAAEAAPFFDEHGAEVVVVLAKASFLRRGDALVRAEVPSPVRLADVPMHPEAEAEGRSSSVRYPSDLGGEKPGADVVVVGSAFSPRPVHSAEVAVRAPGRTLSLRIFGERTFYKGAGGLTLGPAARFESAPVTYERAYGGVSRDGSLLDWRNPVGRGVHRSASELEGQLAPCVEDPAHPIQGTEASIPAGFGALPSWWLPRSAFAGTADEAWQRARMPLPPADFDRRFHQVACPGLQLDRPLRAGDVLATQGLCAAGLFDVTVPALALVAHVRRSDGPTLSLPLFLDTALLEPDADRVDFTFRCVVPLGRGRTLLREVRLDVDD